MAQLTKRFRRILTATLLILLVAGAAYTLGWSKALVIKEISYSGVSAGSPEGMLIKNSLEGAQSELALNKPLARLNIAALANKLNNIDWISRDEISRNWFSGKVTIRISKRVPVAQFRDPSGAAKFIDQSGMEFGLPSAPDLAASSIPAITLNGANLPARVAAARFISAMPASILESMTSLVISENQTIEMNSSIGEVGEVGEVGKVGEVGLLINWGSATDLQNKVGVLNKLLAMPENKKATQIDLTSVTSPVVK